MSFFKADAMLEIVLLQLMCWSKLQILLAVNVSTFQKYSLSLQQEQFGRASASWKSNYNMGIALEVEIDVLLSKHSTF